MKGTSPEKLPRGDESPSSWSVASRTVSGVVGESRGLVYAKESRGESEGDRRGLYFHGEGGS